MVVLGAIMESRWRISIDDAFGCKQSRHQPRVRGSLDSPLRAETEPRCRTTVPRRVFSPFLTKSTEHLFDHAAYPDALKTRSSRPLYTAVVTLSARSSGE
jgi:hypothetical protein